MWAVCFRVGVCPGFIACLYGWRLDLTLSVPVSGWILGLLPHIHGRSFAVLVLNDLIFNMLATGLFLFVTVSCFLLMRTLSLSIRDTTSA
jgi:hypothetical protein